MSIGCPTLSAEDCDKVPWVYYNLEIFVAATPLLSAVPYVVWSILNFTKPSFQAAEYFGSSSRSKGSIRDAGAPKTIVKVIEPKSIFAVLSFAPFFSVLFCLCRWDQL